MAGIILRDKNSLIANWTLAFCPEDGNRILLKWTYHQLYMYMSISTVPRGSWYSRGRSQRLRRRP